MFYAVELWACSPKITIDGHKATRTSDAGVYEFAYLTRPPLDSNGCYSISVKRFGQYGGMVGFCFNDAFSRDDSDSLAWKSTVFITLTGLAAIGTRAELAIGAGTKVSVNGMGRDSGTDTLTIVYNPSVGTLHGAYNIEPQFLLLKDIPAGKNAPLQPFFCSSRVGASIIVVNNPNQN